MKKILLFICLLVALSNIQAQRVLINEFVPDPGNGNGEYIELYNTTGDPINLDCFTLVTYDFGTPGAWVFNLPDVTIAPFGFVVFSSVKPVGHKWATFDSTNLYSWNAVNATQSLRRYTRSGNSLINATINTTTDFIPVSGGNTAALAVMLFKEDGHLSNGFFTNNGSTVPIQVTTLSSLDIGMLPATIPCVTNPVILYFGDISAPTAEVLNVQQAVGINNNYFRTRDGSCGLWDKGQNRPEFTPGKKNSNVPPVSSDPSISITQQQVTCGGAQLNPPEPLISRWNIGVSISNAALLPATVTIYSDNDNTQTLTGPDGSSVGGGVITVINVQSNYTNLPIQKGSSVIVQVVTASGCIQLNRVFSTQCSPLPVDFKSFTATRNKANVMLKWVTATEKNNDGFAVERNVNGNWEQVAYVNSQALSGNSDQDLSYQYIDYNNAKGISQYRIKQVDFDSKSKYTEVRSVKGDGQVGGIVVYPNPTVDGRINVVFDDATVSHDISVIDMSGRTVRQISGIANNNITIDNLMPGMYSLRVFVPATGEQSVMKVVVNKR